MRRVALFLVLAGSAWSGENSPMRVDEPFRPPPIDPEAESGPWKPDSGGPVLSPIQQEELENRRRELAAMLEAVRLRREALGEQGDAEALRDLAAFVAEGTAEGEAATESEALIDRLLKAQEAKRNRIEKKTEQLEKRLELQLDGGKGLGKLKDKKPKDKKPDG